MEGEESKIIGPLSLVTKEQVKTIILIDKGTDAQMISWKTVNFTKLGDNYACTVIGIEVKYSSGSKEQEAFYVAKLNPQRDAEAMKDLTVEFFKKEINFYKYILPKLNGVMQSIEQPPLKFPQCFHSSFEKYREQIYYEDLRKKGFQLFDRRKGMDVNHATLVLRELARLHAASLILQARSSEPIENMHGFTLDDIFSSPDHKLIIFPMLERNLIHSIEMLQKIGGYERAISWVESLKPELEDIFSTQLKNGKYDVICHGDCWNNNILFRYNSDGNPVEVMLLDLQICRKASPATDLNYFMYTSLTSDVRRPNLKDFLASYYDAFKEIMDAGGVAMPFSEEGILKEFRNKNKLGAMFGMMCLPLLLMEPEQVPDLDGDCLDFAQLMEEMNKVSMEMIDKNPMFKPRFLTTFDEFMETGLIP